MRERLDPVERQRADLGVLERDRLAAVAVGGDRFRADDLTRQVIAGDLLAAVVGQHHRLAGPHADRVERGEAVAGAKQDVALAQPDSRGHQPLEQALRLGILDIDRHAHLAHRAAEARRGRPADVAQ